MTKKRTNTDGLTRRELMKAAGASVAGAAALGLLASEGTSAHAAGLRGSEYTLPDLPYPADALEPYLDARTLTIHHDKHHAGYVRGLNSALTKLAATRKSGDYSRMQALCRAVAFHGSGHLLHTLYFANLSPTASAPTGALQAAIAAQYGSLEALLAQLSAATMKVAGSGWGMLAYEPLGQRLLVLQVEKHENQVLCGAAPLLVIDVWEHAYYLKYQNRRADYVKAIAKVLNWKEVARRFEKARRLSA